MDKNTNTPVTPTPAVAQQLYPGQKGFAPDKSVIVGGTILCQKDIDYNCKRKTAKFTVRNTGDRPIQVGSHFHFFEVNRYLDFDRSKAFGCHLNIPATTAIRFEAGDEKSVEIVPYSGKRRAIGFGGLVNGFTGTESAPIYYPSLAKAMGRVYKQGYKTIKK
jgi:urease subunit beta